MKTIREKPSALDSLAKVPESAYGTPQTNTYGFNRLTKTQLSNAVALNESRGKIHQNPSLAKNKLLGKQNQTSKHFKGQSFAE